MAKSNGSGKPVVFIGVDWADQEHTWHALTPAGVRTGTVKQHIEDLDKWVEEMLALANGGTIAIGVEQSRGAFVNSLMGREDVLIYAIDPFQAASFRNSFPGRGKDDPTDAMYLAEMLLQRYKRMDCLHEASDDDCRLLDEFVRQRRKLVNKKTKLRQELTAALKAYFPLFLKKFPGRLALQLDLLSRWSDPRAFKRAAPRVLRRVLDEHRAPKSKSWNDVIDELRNEPLHCKDPVILVSHAMLVKALVKQIKVTHKLIEGYEEEIAKLASKIDDVKLFAGIPGAGPTLTPRLVCAFGTDRRRWDNADQLAAYSGIAPLTKQSGKSKVVIRRFAAPNYLRQTFHEFADATRKWCHWAKAYYRHLRDKGTKHHAAVRKLARSWIRILYRVWVSGTPYDDNAYFVKIMNRRPELKHFLSDTGKEKLEQLTCTKTSD